MRANGDADDHRQVVRLDSPIDPRQGDIEDDASSTKQRSLLALAGGLFTEISLPKLLFAFVLLVLLPGIALGLLPLVATAWWDTVSRTLAVWTGVSAVLVIVVIAWVTRVGGRGLFRIAEANFWALNAMAVQPGYALCREGLRHVAEGLFGRRLSPAGRARLRRFSAIGAGVMVSAIALAIGAYVWPLSQWIGTPGLLETPHRLLVPTLANAVVLLALYLAVAALVWGVADGTMDQPMDLEAFDTATTDARTWRVVHLSDIHVVGQRYGFRLESGRAGPRGNDRLANALARLAAIHAERPLDVLLISGDITDAGLSTEWAEFLDLLAAYPALAARTIVLPGNHDVNIVDRVNPARLDLPFSPGKRLRQMRALAAMAVVQGTRVRVTDPHSGELAGTLGEALSPYRASIADFADRGTLRRSRRLQHLWDDLFPMVLPPDAPDGLGIMILNSNAETHFSFTNAIGLVSARQVHALKAIVNQYPETRWIVALHHHMMEYPMPVKAFAERIGTALINGSWLFRQLRPLGGRAVIMHGHRHVDWMGRCGAFKIVSAPSPVMEATDDQPTHFHLHTLAAGPGPRLDLLQSERIDLEGARPADPLG